MNSFSNGSKWMSDDWSLIACRRIRLRSFTTGAAFAIASTELMSTAWVSPLPMGDQPDMSIDSFVTSFISFRMSSTVSVAPA